ncbi:MAG: hypothetical protein HeimC3_24140 [Candidatus Heimdallarchaeota archaeon LC_3]|nr:MAG: hypothetical protein HeimC3_24140 [Candidatus Heimdallarchaeota archaeon LC_3]
MIINKPAESYRSFLAIGSGMIFVLVTPLLPLYFVEFEESVNGSMATVFWGWQFWQSYLVIGLLVVGMTIRKLSINKGNYLFVSLNLLMAFITVQLILDLNNPLWGVSAPIQSTNWLPYTYIPLLGIILIPLGAIFSDKTKFVGITTKEFIKELFPGIRIGVIAVAILSIPIFLSIIDQFF